MHHIEAFKRDIDNPIFAGKKKELSKANFIYRRLYNFSYFDDTRLLSIGTTFVKILDQFEKNKNNFSQLTDKHFEEIKVLQTKVLEKLNEVDYSSSKEKAKEISYRIAWRINALGRKKGFIEEKTQQDLEDQIKEKIEAWRTRPIGKTAEGHNIPYTKILEDGSSLERTKEAVDKRVQDVAEELAKTPSFVALMNENRELFELAMEWALRDTLPIHLLVEMPRGYQWIKKYMLSTRIALFFREAKKKDPSILENILQTDDKTKYKEMCLPFQGEWKHIHTDSDSTVVLGTEKKCTTTFGAIKSCFERKWGTSGNFEFIPNEGFNNMNAYESARLIDDPNNTGKYIYDKVDFTKPNWIEQLPIIETISKEEAEQRYKKEVVEKNSDILASRTSRTDVQNKMEVMKTHAWVEYAKRNNDGTYSVYDFGTYPENYPYTPWGTLKFIGGCARAVITTFEEGKLYTHREHKIVAKALEGDKVDLFLNTMGPLLQAAQMGLWSFQFLFHGCAMLVETIFSRTFIDEDFTSWFRVNIINARPAGILKHFVTFLWAQPKFLRYYALLALTLVLAGLRGRQTIDISQEKLDVKKTRNVSLWSLASRKMELFIPGKQF